MVEIKALRAGYGGEEVLHGVSLSLEKGKITALIGPNGCGKSTLLKSVVGLTQKTGGEILIDGAPAESLTSAQLAQKAAYLPQSRAVPEMTVMRMVLHGRFAHLSYPRRYRPQDIQAAKNALSWMGIADIADKRVSSLSGGTQQKVYIAMALAQDSPTMLMDEPTAFLDASHRLQTMEIARRLADSGKAVAMVLHDLDLALSNADKLAVIKGGEIIRCGTAEEIFQSHAADEAFRVRLCRMMTDSGWHYYCQK